MKKVLLLLIIIYSSNLFSQTCENYKKTLFNWLPDNFPNEINCIDTNGIKQGWWIYYEIKYNPEDQPDVLGKGYYVNDYIYGKYQNNLKVGKWKTIQNVHLIYESRSDSFYYAEDTTLIISYFAERGFMESNLYYNSDSSVVNFERNKVDEKYPILIKCNKFEKRKGKECAVIYRGSYIRYFPFKQLEIEIENCCLKDDRNKFLIDEKRK